MTAVLVDASGYIYRAFYSQPPMQRSDGTPTGAVHGFCRMIWSVRKHYADAAHFAVMFDKGKSAHRTKIYPAYKAQRSKQPEELISQLSLVRDATRSFGLPVVEMEGVEADDLLASYSMAFLDNGHDVVVVSPDKDLLQLVADGVQIYDPLKSRVMDADGVREKFGVSPELVVDAQALIGDSSDNIPGVKGIGEKKAAALLNEYHSLDAIFENSAFISPPSVRRLIEAPGAREDARMARALVWLDRSVELPMSLRAIEARDVSVDSVIAFADSMEFASFAADLRAFYRVPA